MTNKPWYKNRNNILSKVIKSQRRQSDKPLEYRFIFNNTEVIQSFKSWNDDLYCRRKRIDFYYKTLRCQLSQLNVIRVWFPSSKLICLASLGQWWRLAEGWALQEVGPDHSELTCVRPNAHLARCIEISRCVRALILMRSVFLVILVTCSIFSDTVPLFSGQECKQTWWNEMCYSARQVLLTPHPPHAMIM